MTKNPILTAFRADTIGTVQSRAAWWAHGLETKPAGQGGITRAQIEHARKVLTRLARA